MSAPPVPRVIAHRGASRDRHENTIAAFDEALRQGSDGIELDVQLSRDGVPMIWHDRTLYRAGGGLRRVASLEVTALRRLRVGTNGRGDRLPTLREVLERYGARVELLVEIKLRAGSGGRDGHRRLAHAVVEELRAARLLQRCWILCFDRALLDEIGAFAPAARLVLNLQPPQRAPRGLERMLDGLSAVSADVSRLSVPWARAVRDCGRPLFCYTCNDQRRVNIALAAGVDGLMSDRPGWLRGVLEARAASPRRVTR